ARGDPLRAPTPGGGVKTTVPATTITGEGARICDVTGPECDATVPIRHAGRSHASGSRSPGVNETTSPPALGNVTRPRRNSCNHCRQPPHGEAVIAISTRSPGPQPSTTAHAIAVRSAQIPSGYAAFSTLTPS